VLLVLLTRPVWLALLMLLVLRVRLGLLVWLMRLVRLMPLPLAVLPTQTPNAKH
jgi:hypothetical protein